LDEGLGAAKKPDMTILTTATLGFTLIFGKTMNKVSQAAEWRSTLNLSVH
jgi:hypothetical protein